MYTRPLFSSSDPITTVLPDKDTDFPKVPDICDPNGLQSSPLKLYTLTPPPLSEPTATEFPSLDREIEYAFLFSIVPSSISFPISPHTLSLYLYTLVLPTLLVVNVVPDTVVRTYPGEPIAIISPFLDMETDVPSNSNGERPSITCVF